MKRMMWSTIALVSMPLAGATLQVYSDAVFYDFTAPTTFIGVSNVRHAECGNEAVGMRRAERCEDNATACRTFRRIQAQRFKVAQLRRESATLDLFEQALNLQSIHPEAWFKQAQQLAHYRTRLDQRTDRLSRSLKELERTLKRQTDASFPVALARPCDKRIHLTLPGGAIRFQPHYEANVTGDKVRVTQILEVTNRSGLDLNVTQADFFNAPSAPPMQLPHFWSETLSDEPPKIAMRRVKAMVADAPVMEAAVPTDRPVKVSKQGNRHYRIAPFRLSSSGDAKRFPLRHDNFAVRCRNEWAAYGQRYVYRVCRFKPTFEVEHSLWRVTIDGILRSTRAQGRYEEGAYALYVMPVPSIKVQRHRYIPKKKEDGFFNTTVRKKDGSVLTLTNTEAKPITVVVSARIPVSTTEKIRVKLLPIKGVRNVRTDKQGKVTFTVSMKGFETKEIAVLYEIDHDKATKVYRNR